MSSNTSIEWTDFTFNPWWGCSRVSPGCANCYAATLGHRFGVEWGPSATRRPASEKTWADPVRWNNAAKKAGKRAKVFCASMADVFDDNAPEYALSRLFDLMRNTPWLDWQVLTKRPENIKKNLPGDWGKGGYRNVWLGVSVENQDMADKRIPILLGIPAAVRFLSCEPLLGPVDIRPYLFLDGGVRKCWECGYFTNRTTEIECPNRCGAMKDDRSIDWVIVGGESGSAARPMHPDWARSLRDQCQNAGVPFLFKQWGEFLHNGEPPEWASQTFNRVGKKAAGRILDGIGWNQFPPSPLLRITKEPSNG